VIEAENQKFGWASHLNASGVSLGNDVNVTRYDAALVAIPVYEALEADVAEMWEDETMLRTIQSSDSTASWWPCSMLIPSIS